MAKGSGGGLGLVAIVGVLVIGAAAFNYWRNYQQEQEEAVARPYQGYDDAELESLIGAYRAEVDALERRFATAGSDRAAPSASAGAHISEHLADFEHARRAGDRKRERTGAVAQQEAVLRELETEQRLRASAAQGLDVHLRRLTTF